MLVGALVLVADFVAAFFVASWVVSASSAEHLVATLGAVLVGVSPVCGTVVAPTNGDSFSADVGMLVGALILVADVLRTLTASLFDWFGPCFVTLVGIIRATVRQITAHLTSIVGISPVGGTVVASSDGVAFDANKRMAWTALVLAARYFTAWFASSPCQTAEMSTVAIIEEKDKHEDVVIHGWGFNGIDFNVMFSICLGRVSAPASHWREVPPMPA